jgi:hypothetical protein
MGKDLEGSNHVRGGGVIPTQPGEAEENQLLDVIKKCFVYIIPVRNFALCL